MDEGHVVVDSIEPIRMADVTYALARESGFTSVADLLGIAKHGRGENVYLIRFHYLPPGGWDLPRTGGGSEKRDQSTSKSSERTELLRRIQSSSPVRADPKGRRSRRG
jgi:hypothetical protein